MQKEENKAMVKKTLQRTDLPKRRCKAKKRSTGEQCGNAPIRGGTVCRFHGGAAPQVRAKAEEQLKASRDALMAALLSIALDEEHSPSDRLKAITWALERAGFKGSVAVEVELKPWEKVLQGMWEEEGEQPELEASEQPALPSAETKAEQDARLKAALDDWDRHHGRGGALSGEILPARADFNQPGSRVTRARLG